MTYNDAGRLYQLHSDGVLVAGYIYNHAGQRTHKAIFDAGGTALTTIVYHSDGQGHLISETDENGGSIRDYIWHESMLYAPLQIRSYLPLLDSELETVEKSR